MAAQGVQHPGRGAPGPIAEMDLETLTTRAGILPDFVRQESQPTFIFCWWVVPKSPQSFTSNVQVAALSLETKDSEDYTRRRQRSPLRSDEALGV